MPLQTFWTHCLVVYGLDLANLREGVVYMIWFSTIVQTLVTMWFSLFKEENDSVAAVLNTLIESAVMALFLLLQPVGSHGSANGSSKMMTTTQCPDSLKLRYIPSFLQFLRRWSQLRSPNGSWARPDLMPPPQPYRTSLQSLSSQPCSCLSVR